MSIPRTGSSPLDKQTDDDLIATAPRVLQGGLIKMGVAPTPSVTPLLVSATPADNSGAVGVSNDIVLHFNTAVQAGSGSIVISDGHSQSYIDGSGALASRIVGATDTRTLSLSDSQVSISGQDVTIHLSTPLKAGTGYSVTMAAGVLTDTGASHLAYAGLANTTLLNFTTSAAHSAPTAVIGATIDFTDTGSNTHDYITNSAAQTLHGTYSGTLQTGEFVQVSLDNGANWYLASATGGSWNYSGSSISASSTMLARVSNIYAQNSGTASHDYTYLSGHPTAYVSSNLSFSADTGSSAADRITSTAAQTISGSVVGTLAAGEHVELSLDNGVSWHEATLNGAGTAWTYDTTLNAGTNLLRARVADIAGNSYEGSQYSYSLHTGAYNLGAAGIKVATSSDTNIVGDNITKAATKITVTGLGNGGLHVGDTINLIDQSNSNAIVGSYTFTSSNLDHYGNGILDNGYGTAISSWDINVATGVLGNGSHTLAAQVVDALAGLTGVISPSVTIKVDNVAPSLSSVTHIDADSNAATPDDIVLTFSENVAIATGASFLISDGNSANDQTLSAANAAQVTVSGATVTLHISATLDASASYTVTVNDGNITDIAGNNASFQSGGNAIVRFLTDSGSHVSTTTIITAPPTATVTAAIALSHDNGSSSCDLITNVAAQTISGAYNGTLVGDQTVQVSTDDGATWHNVLPANIDPDAHTWSYDGTLLTGDNTLRVRVADSSGGTTAEQKHVYTYDNVAPAVSLTLTNQDPTLHLSANAAVHLDPESETGPSGSDVTQSTSPSFQVSGLADLKVAAGDILQIVDLDHGSAVIASHTIDASELGGNYGGLLSDVQYFSLGSGVCNLSEGTHNLVVRIADLAGNTGAASSASIITIDNTAPAADISNVILQLASGQDTGANTSDGVTNIQTPHISVNLAGVSGLQAGDILRLGSGESTIGQHQLQASELDGSGHLLAGQLEIQVDSDRPLYDGLHEIRLYIADQAGNSGNNSTQALSVTIDTSVASMACIQPDLDIGSDSGNPDTDNWTAIATPTINVELGSRDGYSEGDVLQLLDNGTLVSSLTLHPASMGASSNLVQLTVSTALPDGDHQFTTRIVDIAGNIGTATNSDHTLTVKIDSVPPPSMATVTPDLADSSDDGNSSSDNHTTVTTPTITVDLRSISGFNDRDLVFLFDGSTELAHEVLHPTAANGYGPKIDFVLSQPLSVGTHNFSVITQDAVGHNGISTDVGHLLTVTVEAPVPQPSPAPTGLGLAFDSYSLSNGSLDGHGEKIDGVTNNGNVVVTGLSGITGTTWSYSTDSGGHWISGVPLSTTGFALGAGDYTAGAIMIKQTVPGQGESASITNQTHWVIDSTPYSAKLDPSATASFDADSGQTISGQYVSADGSNDEIVELSFDHGSSWVRAVSTTNTASVSNWTYSNATVIDGVLMHISDAAGNIGNTEIAGHLYGQSPIYFGSSADHNYTPATNTIIYGGSGNDIFSLTTSMLNASNYKGILAGGGGANWLNLAFDNGATMSWLIL